MIGEENYFDPESIVTGYVNLEMLDAAEEIYNSGYVCGKNDTLDKIRVEIEHLHDWAFSREDVLKLIEKEMSK